MSPSRALLEGFKTATSVGGYNMATCKSAIVRAPFDYQHARIHLYSRHVALSGSGTWDYVSLRWLMTLPIYKKTTTLIVSGCISQHQGANEYCSCSSILHVIIQSWQHAHIKIPLRRYAHFYFKPGHNFILKYLLMLTLKWAVRATILLHRH